MMRIVFILLTLSVYNLHNVSAATNTDICRLMKPSSGEVYLGKENDNTKVRVVFYGSTTCPHCATLFTSFLPGLRYRYINKGYDIMFLHRPFVSDITSMAAAEIVYCASKFMNSDQYFRLLYMIYSKQHVWAVSADFRQKLRDLVSTFVDIQKIEGCMRSNDITDSLANMKNDAMRIAGVDTLPTIFVNNHHTSDVRAAYELIDSELKK